MKCVKAATPKISRPGFEFWKNQQREDGEEPLEAEGGRGKTKGGKDRGPSESAAAKSLPRQQASLYPAKTAITKRRYRRLRFLSVNPIF